MATLRRGNRGTAVMGLQQKLNQIGYSLTVDGIFGKGTEDAVKDVQRKAGLVIDGLAGTKTMWAIDNATTKHIDHLSEDDIREAADSLGVDIASVKAVNEVESRGNGFEKDGTLKMLFERHIMYRQLKKNISLTYADQCASKYPDIVNRASGGYIGGSKEATRLQRAITLDRNSAYESASYGLYQIMGFNAMGLGYDSAESMYQEFCTGEKAQLEGFVRFIKDDKNLWNALKKRDWATFARLYNGPAYAKNAYDTKLAKAYAKYSA